MDIKLMAFDLDGTALDDMGGLPATNRAAIVRAAGAGVLMVPCTGRCYHEIPETLLQMPQLPFIITSNGAVTYRDGQVMAARCLEPEPAILATQKLVELDALPELYVRGRAYSRYTAKTLPALIEKYHIPEGYVCEYTRTRLPIGDPVAFARQSGDAIEKLHAFLHGGQDYGRLVALLGEAARLLEITSSGFGNIELTRAGVSKGAALRGLCETLGMPPAQAAVVGDSHNDLPMFAIAGYGFAPQNSAEEVKRAANEVVCSNAEGALAAAVGRVCGPAGAE